MYRGSEVWKGMWSNIIVGRLWNQLLVSIGVMLSLAVQVGCGERENILVIEKPTEVHAIIQTSPSQDPNTNVQSGNVIATLKAGDIARAVGVYHGQDQDGFKVKLADGTEGLIFAGDTFKVMSR